MAGHRQIHASEAALNRLIEAATRVNAAAAGVLEMAEALLRAGADMAEKSPEATEPVCLSAEDLGKALGGISKQTIYQAAKRGEIPFHVLGGRKVFHLQDVLAATRATAEGREARGQRLGAI